MKLLLDTHLLLWAADSETRVPEQARTLIEDTANELFFSVASIWEVAIKGQRERVDFRADPRLLRRSLLDNDYQELAIRGDHAVALSSLPDIHRDPFDRIMIAQAIVEGITLLTVDGKIAQYGGPIRVVQRTRNMTSQG